MVLPPDSSAGHRLARASPLWVVMPQRAATKGPQPCPYATLWRKEEVISGKKEKNGESNAGGTSGPLPQLSHCAGAWTHGNKKQRVGVALVISWLPFKAFCGFVDPPLLGACLRGVSQSCNLQLLAPGCSNTELLGFFFYHFILFIYFGLSGSSLLCRLFR